MIRLAPEVKCFASKPGSTSTSRTSTIEEVKKFLRNAMGVGLVILGIIGLILPIMPGWVFLVPGLMILAEEFPWLDKFLNRWLAWAKEKMSREQNLDKNDASGSGKPTL
jgi:hypothetical protein